MVRERERERELVSDSLLWICCFVPVVYGLCILVYIFPFRIYTYFIAYK